MFTQISFSICAIFSKFGKPVRTSVFRYGLLLTMLSFSAIGLQAQSTADLDISEFSHATEFLGMQGDTMAFALRLGTLASPAENVLGLAVQLNFPRLATAPTAILTQTKGTWLGTGISNPQVFQSFAPHKAVLQVSFERPDGIAHSGEGAVFTIALVRPGGFSPAEAAILLDDGIVMVDNVDLRVAQPRYTPDSESFANVDTQLAMRIFPNPSSDFIHIEFGAGAQPLSSVRIVDPQQQFLRNIPLNGDHMLDIRALPQGNYYLVAEGYLPCQFGVRR